jgi:hypothetical protein
VDAQISFGCARLMGVCVSLRASWHPVCPACIPTCTDVTPGFVLIVHLCNSSSSGSARTRGRAGRSSEQACTRSQAQPAGPLPAGSGVCTRPSLLSAGRRSSGATASQQAWGALTRCEKQAQLEGLSACIRRSKQSGGFWVRHQGRHLCRK